MANPLRARGCHSVGRRCSSRADIPPANPTGRNGKRADTGLGGTESRSAPMADIWLASERRPVLAHIGFGCVHDASDLYRQAESNGTASALI
jgi:hypothetical protein